VEGCDDPGTVVGCAACAQGCISHWRSW